MSDTFSTMIEILGGKIRELPGGQFVAVSWFQYESEYFGTFDAAQKWLLLRMDSALAKRFGGKIRKSSSETFVATSDLSEETSIHTCFWEAEGWLLEQKELASSTPSHINTKTEE